MDDLDPEIERLLLDADAALPMRRQEYDERQAQLPGLQSQLGEILQHPLSLIDDHEDAGFYATLTLRLPNKGGTTQRLGYTFSLYANLVAVQVDPTWADPPLEQIEAAAALLTKAGFVLIPWEQAMHVYTGERTASDGTPFRDRGDQDWIWRFFDND